MKARAAELRAEGKKGAKKADDLQAALDSIASMTPEDRAIAERVHVTVTENAPDLSPKTWYGMPAYANADGKVVFAFKNSGKFNLRYSTLEFQDAAKLDDGDLWPVSFAVWNWTPAVEKTITELCGARRLRPAPPAGQKSARFPGAQPKAVGVQRVVVPVLDVDRLLRRRPGQLTGSLPVNPRRRTGRRRRRRPRCRAARRRPGRRRPSRSVTICGRPETTSTTQVFTWPQTLSTAARSSGCNSRDFGSRGCPASAGS